jgi:hypothetical protein
LALKHKPKTHFLTASAQTQGGQMRKQIRGQFFKTAKLDEFEIRKNGFLLENLA